MQAKQSDAQELTSGQASTMARNEQVIDTLTGTHHVMCLVCCMLLGADVCLQGKVCHDVIMLSLIQITTTHGVVSMLMAQTGPPTGSY